MAFYKTEDMFEKFMNFGHHDEFRLSGITIDKIKDKISKREMFTILQIKVQLTNGKATINYKILI